MHSPEPLAHSIPKAEAKEGGENLRTPVCTDSERIDVGLGGVVDVVVHDAVLGDVLGVAVYRRYRVAVNVAVHAAVGLGGKRDLLVDSNGSQSERTVLRLL